MAFLLETKHTRSRINNIKNDLNKVKNVVNLLGMIAFAVYYAYLIYLNIYNVLYLIVYSGLFACILLFYIVDTAIKEKSVFDSFLLLVVSDVFYRKKAFYTFPSYKRYAVELC